MKNRIRFIVLTLACLIKASPCNAIDPEKWSLSAGLTYADISGVRTYGAKYLEGKTGTHETYQTESLWTPTVSLRYELSDRFAFDTSYTQFQGIQGLGISNDSDIFNENEVALFVLTPYHFSENIHDISTSIWIKALDRKKWAVELAPTLSYFSSSAIVAGRKFSADDLRLGASVRFNTNLTTRWSGHFGFRYAAPPDREVRVFSLGASYHF